MSKRGNKKRGYGPTGFEKWGGYMAAKASKLNKQFKENAKEVLHKNNLFEGICIFVNGYTEPTSEELKRIMMTYGGTFHHYYSSSSTTHIIASNLPNTKIKNMNTERVVHPRWIVESIEAGKCLDYTKYLLYTNESRSQPKIMFETKPKSDPRNGFGSSNSKEEIEGEQCLDLLSKNTLDIDNKNCSRSSCSRDIQFEELDHISSSSNNSQGDIKFTVDGHEVSLPITNNSIDVALSTKAEDKPSDFNGIVAAHSNNTSPAKNASDPNFLSEFYNNSRLHHISTMGATFKQYVSEIQKNKSNFSGREDFIKWLQKESNDECDDIPDGRTIMHIDMDCFFVSVGLRNLPQYKDKPVAVCHSKGTPKHESGSADRQKEFDLYRKREMEKRSNSNSEQPSFRVDGLDDHSSLSEIASCNYEARKYGLKNGMFLGTAKKMCPNLITIPYDFEGYKNVSYKLYDIVASFTHDIEAISCDEMFIDISEILKSCRATPDQFATFLRDTVQQSTKCPCSTGIGPNMLIARMATRTAKPNGQFYIDFDKINDYIINEPVGNLPGVGRRTQEQLQSLGVSSCGELQTVSLGKLQHTVGNRTGQVLYNYCRGIDDRPIKSDQKRKSVSTEVNYGIRFSSNDEVDKFMKQLSDEVENRLKNVNSKGKQITLKLKVRAKDAPEETAKFLGHGFCDNIAKSTSLQISTNSASVVHREIMKLLNPLNIPAKDLRGIGIQVSKLDEINAGDESKDIPSIKNFFATGKRKSEELYPKINLNTSSNKEKISNKFNLSNWVESKTNKDNGAFVKKLKTSNTNNGFNSHSESNHLNSNNQGGTNSNSHHQAGTSSNSKKELDLEVLNALPEDMREAIIEEYKNQGYIIPNNDKKVIHCSAESGPSGLCPKSHKFNTPSSNSFSTQSSQSQEIDEMSISFSQVDESFLAALPEDLKEELKSDLESGKNKIPKANPTKEMKMELKDQQTNINNLNTNSILFELDEDSRTNDSLPYQHLDENEANEIDDGSNEMVTSFSQVDKSFLEALPEDVREELKKDLNREKERKKLNNLSPQNSPSKQRTVDLLNFGSKKALPVKNVGGIKKKRGRKSKKLVNPTKNSIYKITSKKPDISQPISNHEEKETETELKTTQTSPDFHSKEPNLCGEVEISNIKVLIQQWVTSCTTPQDEDTLILVNFYTSLVEGRNLEMLDLLLKYLRRMIKKNDTESWKCTYTTITEEVQKSMMNIYKSKLKIDGIFM